MDPKKNLKDAIQIAKEGLLLLKHNWSNERILGHSVVSEDAKDKWKVARSICERNLTKRAQASIEIIIGNGLCDLHHFKEGIKHFNKAKQLMKNAKLKSELALIALLERNTGNALYKIDQLAEAMEHYNSALEKYEQLEIPIRVAELAILQSRIHLKDALFDECIKKLQFAEDVYRQIGKLDDVTLASIELARGEVLGRLGKIVQARNKFDSAKKIFERRSKLKEVAKVEKATGFALLNGYSILGDGDFENAIKHFERAETSYLKLKMPLDFAETVIAKCNALIRLNRLDEAQDELEKAIPLTIGINKSLYALVNMNQSLILAKKYRNLEDYSYLILDQMKRAIDKLRQTNSFHLEKCEAVENLVFVENFIRVPMDDSNRLRLLQDNLYNLGTTMLRRQMYCKSLQSPELRLSFRQKYLYLYDMLIYVHLQFYLLATRAQQNPILYEFFYSKRYKEEIPKLMGQFLYVDTENIAEKYHLFMALTHLETAKCSSTTEFLRLCVHQGEIQYPKEMLNLLEKEDLLLNIMENKQLSQEMKIDSRDNNESFDIDNTVGFREIESEYPSLYKEIEKTRSEAMLKWANADNWVIFTLSKGDIIEKVMSNFPKDTSWGIIEFCWIPPLSKLYVFLITPPNKIDLGTCDINPEEINGLVKQCQNVFNLMRNVFESKRKKANDILDDLSKRLYDTLIPKEIGELIKNLHIDYLIIVPHRLLHWVPFEILSDGEHFWGLKYAVSTQYSLDITRLTIENRNKILSESDNSFSFLLVKNPTLDRFSENEVDEIIKLLSVHNARYASLPPENSPSDPVTQELIVQKLNSLEFNFWYHDGHAVFLGKEPSQSFLYLHSSNCPKCNSRGKEHKWEKFSANEILYKVKFKASPVIYLSACESGTSEIKEGDEISGLSVAFFCAGASSLIVSRWSVEQDVAPVFAKSFFEQLLTGSSVAIALREARNIVYNDKQFSFKDWAVFTLQGDPFRTFEVAMRANNP